MIPTPIELARECVRRVVQEGETVVDGTLGNGYDAEFLAKLVGENGQLIGFDVQQCAIGSTTQRLREAGISESAFSLHLCGHERVGEFVEKRLAAAMFNLGYLPRADKEVITKAETTIPALDQTARLLRVGGVLTVMCYRGHEGGNEEVAAVRQWAMELPRSAFLSAEYSLLNAPNAPAFLITVGRQREL